MRLGSRCVCDVTVYNVEYEFIYSSGHLREDGRARDLVEPLDVSRGGDGVSVEEEVEDRHHEEIGQENRIDHLRGWQDKTRDKGHRTLHTG